MTSHILRRIAVEAGDVDPRTVARFLRGDRVTPVNRERIESALARLGLSETGQGPALVNGRLDPAAFGGPLA
jgi:hypothetical protein